MATANSNAMETTIRRENKTTGRRTERRVGTYFPTRRSLHRASGRFRTRLFWA